MNINKELNKNQELENISEFSELILNIMEYYELSEDNASLDESDEWKLGTKYANKGIIPKDLNKKIKELFIIKTNYLIELEKNKIFNLNKNE